MQCAPPLWLPVSDVPTTAALAIRCFTCSVLVKWIRVKVGYPCPNPNPDYPVQVISRMNRLRVWSANSVLGCGGEVDTAGLHFFFLSSGALLTCMFPCHGPLVVLLSKDRHGIFNVRNYVTILVRNHRLESKETVQVHTMNASTYLLFVSFYVVCSLRRRMCNVVTHQ